MAEVIKVQCKYCNLIAPIIEMRLLPDNEGFACRNIEACDIREEKLNPEGIYGD